MPINGSGTFCGNGDGKASDFDGTLSKKIDQFY